MAAQSKNWSSHTYVINAASRRRCEQAEHPPHADDFVPGRQAAAARDGQRDEHEAERHSRCVR